MSNSGGINDNKEDSYNESEELSEQISFFNLHQEVSDNVTIGSGSRTSVVLLED
ncbi:2695_t:CDS:2 [Scutellospora calospora]|uniref:2695_t:CDS:1 n=1 Tax=Scutellospora calospora TaxID=85575 RepID=A0ACA9LCC6_9GLOM|nr:2695_t:CDS:2 [Scutellospora calospora]